MNYSEIGIPVRRIPVAIQVGVIAISVEPGNRTVVANLPITTFSSIFISY